MIKIKEVIRDERGRFIGKNKYTFKEGYKLTQGQMDKKIKKIKMIYKKGNSKMGFQKGHKDFVSKESRRKIAEKNKISNRGKKFTKEHRENMGKAFKGKTYEEISGKEKADERRKNLSLVNSGENNAFYGKTHSIQSRIKQSSRKQGIPLEKWEKFVGRESYGIEFNKKLKEKIRERDNQICQECGKLQKELKRLLDIHHIDYNKKNNNSNNLISLCNNCHMKTNFNRKHWERYFKNIMALKEIFNPENLLIFNRNKQLIGVNKI